MRTLKRIHNGKVVEQTNVAETMLCFAFEKQDGIDIETPLQTIGGMLVYLFDASHTRPYLFSEDLTQAIENRLTELGFNPDRHRIILSGNLVSVAALVSVVAADYGYFTALAFDTKIKAYREMIMG